jgi:hypothetical protein
MNSPQLFFLFLILISSITLTSGISISCDCRQKSCQCTSDCSDGWLNIYEKGCQGSPSYELPLSQGKSEWLPPHGGEYYEYYLRVLCDNQEKSNCQLLKVSPSAEREVPGDFFSSLFLTSLIAVVALLIYPKYIKK